MGHYTETTGSVDANKAGFLQRSHPLFVFFSSKLLAFFYLLLLSALTRV